MKSGNKIASAVAMLAHRATAQDEITAVSTLATLQREARKALKDNAAWAQEFHGNELVAVIAMLSAMRKVTGDKEAALKRAISFIGSFEGHEYYGKAAVAALEDINQILAGESIQETQNKTHE